MLSFIRLDLVIVFVHSNKTLRQACMEKKWKLQHKTDLFCPFAIFFSGFGLSVGNLKYSLSNK